MERTRNPLIPSPNLILRVWKEALLLSLMVAAVAWLRWPTLDFKVWNVDEAIHATVARTLLEGGVLYRDAVDQRAPLTYYTVAVLFSLFGENNILAMHWLTVGLIASTALGLFVLGRLWRNAVTGISAALLYAVLSSTLFYPGDAYAFATEWFVAFFVVWSAVVLWLNLAHSAHLGTAGILTGLAFLSKQPALLEIAPPLTVILCWSPVKRGWRIAAFLGGWAVPVIGSVIYFWLHAALRDYIFYAWTYNLKYYGPEISLPDRLHSAWKPFTLLATHPAVLISILAGMVILLVHFFRGRTDFIAAGNRPACLHLLLWAVVSLAASASGGRAFDHYYIQFLPALCLLAAISLGACSVWIGASRRRMLSSVIALTAFAAVVANLLGGIRLARTHQSQPVDPSLRAAEFIRANTLSEERIFVWGFHPDIYLFANRRPASRFVFASFVSGLIPWTNTAPGQDTAYAIVPGAMETLLRELENHRPAFIVDCSAGPNRYWNKYPLQRFPALLDFVEKNYLVAEPNQFVPQGFRLYMIRDSFRRTPKPLAGELTASTPPRPGLQVVPAIGRLPAHAVLLGSSQAGRLQRLELLADDVVVASATFAPAVSMLLDCTLPADTRSHRYSVRATSAGGVATLSLEQVSATNPPQPTHALLQEFCLAATLGSIEPDQLQISFGASAESSGDQRRFLLHAPAMLSYPLPPGASKLSGAYGLRPEAYVDQNPTPTDGAEFHIEYILSSGATITLLHRWLQPRTHEADRGPQTFLLTLPENAGSGQLSFTIGNGPAGSATNDWTYWADLKLENSR